MIAIAVVLLCTAIGLLGFGFFSLVSGAVLYKSGRSLHRDSKRKLIGTILLILSLLSFTGVGAMAFYFMH